MPLLKINILESFDERVYLNLKIYYNKAYIRYKNSWSSVNFFNFNMEIDVRMYLWL